MTADQIIMAMVEGLTHPPIINVEMDTYGKYEWGWTKVLGVIPFYKRMCFGCAATNTICGIAGKPFTPRSITSPFGRANFLGVRMDFLQTFELAINELRKGFVAGYNLHARIGGFALIESKPNLDLPLLSNDYTSAHLERYKELAIWQRRATR